MVSGGTRTDGYGVAWVVVINIPARHRRSRPYAALQLFQLANVNRVITIGAVFYIGDPARQSRACITYGNGFTRIGYAGQITRPRHLYSVRVMSQGDTAGLSKRTGAYRNRLGRYCMRTVTYRHRVGCSYRRAANGRGMPYCCPDIVFVRLKPYGNIAFPFQVRACLGTDRDLIAFYRVRPRADPDRNGLVAIHAPSRILSDCNE